jgi:hypothetical protein
LARLEQLVAQGLEAGNQQAAALRTVVDSNLSRLDELAAGQRELLALKDQVTQQQETLSQYGTRFEATGSEITGVRSGLEQRLAEVTSRLSALDAARERGVGLSIAVHDIEAALQAGNAFQPALQTLDQLAQGDQTVTSAIAKLQPVAASGVVTQAELTRGLEEIEGSLQPATTAPADDWLARTRENLGGLVNLHAAGEEAVPGQAAVQSARQALQNGELAGAVSALEPLAQQGNSQAAAWVDAARKRLAAREALESLQQHVKTVLAQQG